jgi:Xaa-Pro aminopeptidase
MIAVDARSLKKSLELRNSELVSLQQNPVDIVWGKDRPIHPHNKVFSLDVKYAGQYDLRFGYIDTDISSRRDIPKQVTTLT